MIKVRTDTGTSRLVYLATAVSAPGSVLTLAAIRSTRESFPGCNWKKRSNFKVNGSSGMILYIKNMVSIRCLLIVKAHLEKLGIPYLSVELGEVEINENISEEKFDQLNTELRKTGLELLEDKRSIIVEKIRNIIVEMIHYSDELPKIKTSQYISQKLNLNYNYISYLFSEVRGTTIEHYIVTQKIERAKELISYDELTLTDIASKLHYRSVAHLSSQFKRVTGLTPIHFKKMRDKRRIPLGML